MGSSGGGMSNAPGIPRYSNAPTNPPGGSPLMAGVPSFLPADPNAMAMGLTPDMLSAINTPPPAPPPMNRDMLAGAMANNPMRNQFGQLSGQELLGMKFGRQPQNFDPRAARNDQLMRIFAGSMGGVGGQSGGGRGRGAGGGYGGSGGFGGGGRKK